MLGTQSPMDKTDINRTILTEDSRNYILFLSGIDNINKNDISGLLRAINNDYQRRGAQAVNASLVLLLRELGNRLDMRVINYIQRKVETMTSSDPQVVYRMIQLGMYNDKLYPFLVDNEHTLLDIIRWFTEGQMPVSRPKHVAEFIDINRPNLVKLEQAGYSQDVMELMRYEHELSGDNSLISRAQQLYDTESDDDWD